MCLTKVCARTVSLAFQQHSKILFDGMKGETADVRNWCYSKLTHRVQLHVHEPLVIAVVGAVPSTVTELVTTSHCSDESDLF